MSGMQEIKLGSFTVQKAIRFFIGMGIGAFFLYLCLKDSQWDAIVNIVLRADPRWILLALGFYWLELWLRIQRWQKLIFHSISAADIKLTGIAFIAGYAANNVLPAKLGELFRADLLGRLTDTSRFAALGSIILERLLDMLVILGMATCGIVLVSSATHMIGEIEHAIFLIGMILAVAFVCLVILIRKETIPLPAGLHRFSIRLQHLITGLHLLKNPASYSRLAMVSGTIWMFNSLAIWSILMSLGIHLSIPQMLLLLGVIGIAAAIPSAPAGIGTLQYAFYIVFILFHLPASAGIAASGVIQIVLLGSATIVGGGLYLFALFNHLLPIRR